MANRNEIIEKLQNILALTNSPVEGEAQAAAAMLQKFLTKHNLSMADLEKRGQAAPEMHEGGHDLGKAAFTWKLNLAETIADYYYCFGMVDRSRKTVRFIGRPDNVEALTMLYGWLIDQIKRIARDERRVWIEETHEHIDPLRWQVNFGIGAVERLGERLRSERQRQMDQNETTALVVHHKTEISDYMEEKYGRRVDGQDTKSTREWRERMNAKREQKQADRLSMTDEDFWAKYPEEHPNDIALRAKNLNDWLKKEDRNAKRRTGRAGKAIDWEKEAQAGNARDAGRSAASKINMQPFIEGGTNPDQRSRIN